MDCPRCGQTAADGPSCPRCGVVFAKLRPASAPPPARVETSRPTEAPRPHARLSLILAPLGLAPAAGLGFVLLRPPPPPPPPSPAPRPPPPRPAPPTAP